MKLKYRLGALALVAVAIVAFALPDMLVDKDRLRDRLVRSVYEATGRELAIEGGLGLSLLPVPRLSATRVRLSNPPGSAEPWMAEVERVTARLDFWELMLGRISLRDLSLDKPVIRFAAGPDGGGNWNFLRPGELPPRFPRAAVTARPQPGSAAPAAEASPKVRFERLSIVDGRVSYADGKRSWTAEGLFVDVDANDLSGPFLFSGRVTLAGQKVKIRGDVGKILARHAVAVRLDAGAAPARVHIDGLILRDTDDGPVVKVSVQAAAADAGRILAAAGLDGIGGFDGRAAVLAGQLRAGAARGELSEGILKIGDAEVAVQASWWLDGARPRLDLGLSVAHFDADAWTAPRASSASFPAGKGVSPSAAAHAAEPAPEKPAFPPAAIDIDLHLSAATVMWRGGLLRDVAADASLSPEGLIVHQAAAGFPGAARVQGYGILTAGVEIPTLNLTVQAASDNLRGTLDWMGISTASVPADRLRKAKISFALLGAGDSLLKFRDVDLDLDTTHVRAAADVRLGARPAVGLSIAADQFNLDAYRKATGPAPGTSAVPPAPSPGKTGAPKPALSFASPWEAIDASLDLKLGRLIAGGQSLEHVNARGLWSDRVLALDALTADLGERGRISAAGKLDVRDGLRAEDIRLGLETDRADRLFALVPVRLPDFVRAWRALKVRAVLGGPFSDLAAEIDLTAGKARAVVKGGFDALGLRPTHAGEIEISAPDLGALAKAVGAGLAPDLAAKGDVLIRLPIAADADGFSVKDFSARAGDETLAGSLGVDTRGPRPKIALKVEGTLLPLPELPGGGASHLAAPPSAPAVDAPTAAATPNRPPLPAWMEIVRSSDGTLSARIGRIAGREPFAADVDVDAAWTNGALTVSRLDAKALEGPLAATGRLEVAGDVPALAAKLDWTGGKVARKSPLFPGGEAPVTGIIDVAAEVTARGTGPDAWLATLAGTASLTARNGTVRGADLGVVNDRLTRVKTLQDLVAAFSAAAGGGRTAYDTLSGHFKAEAGVLSSDDLAISGPSGKGTARGKVVPATRRIDAELSYALAAFADAPPVRVRLDGDWSSPRVFFETGDFQAHMIRKGLARLLRGLGKPKASRAPEPPAPRKDKPAEVRRETLVPVGQ